MINIKDLIRTSVTNILGDVKVSVEVPPKKDMGDYSVPCFTLTNSKYDNPNKMANYLKENISNEYFTNISVMGPYLNFEINYNLLAPDLIKDIESKKEKYGSLNQGRNESLLIEHTSINPNAEPHMGRCRNTFIGDFMANLYSFTGYDVERHYFVNDLGKKIALLVLGVEKYGNGNETFYDILDIYVKISNEAKEDPSIEEKAFDYLETVESGDTTMVNKFKSITDKCVEGQMEILSKLNIKFDIFTHESDYVYNNYLNNIVDKLKEKNKYVIDELGRGCADLSGYNISLKEPYLVLTRSNGTSLYPIKDIAYNIYKVGRNSKNNYVVLGEDQEVYMQEIAATLDILGYSAPELISYGYVLLGGNKMSTSNGVGVLVTDFIKEIKSCLSKEFEERNIKVSEDSLDKLMIACIKFTMLNVSKQKTVDFNIENAISFKGESGIYILYSIVRINSILEKNEITTQELRFTKDIEYEILNDLYNYNELINNLLNTKEPSLLTKYIFNLTQKFSSFYEEVNISKEEDEVLKSSRLRLILAVKQVLTNSLKILGIDTVDKM